MRLAQVSRWIMAAAVKSSEVARVEAKTKDGKCILPDCDCERQTRGLCQRHYQQFIRSLRETPKGERADFEAKAIKRGLVLAAQGIRDYTRQDPFEECKS